MITTRTRFQSALEAVTEDTKSWLIDEFKTILEAEKDYTRKADYIGFSIAHMDAKIQSLDEEIKELQNLKKKLKLAKDTALTIGAEVFGNYGIEKLEGAGISSITVTKPSTTVKTNLKIIDEEALISAGFYKKVLDTDAVIAAHLSDSDSIAYMTVQEYSSYEQEEVTTLAKLKVNKRRGVNTNNYNILEEIAS